MSTKFTPGPWGSLLSNTYWLKNGIVIPGYLITKDRYQENEKWVATAWARSPGNLTHQEAEANAHLLAAAPDLYETLAILVLDPTMSFFLRGTDTKAFEQATAALAKARGEI